MKMPLENFDDFVSLCSEGPTEIKEFLELTGDSYNSYRDRCRRLIDDLAYYNRTYEGVVGDILKVKNLLDTMVWEFLSIIKKYCEDNNIKEKKVVNALESDLDSYMNHINTTFETTFQGPQTSFHLRRVSYLSQNLATIFNSLIGPCLLDAYKKSVRTRIKLVGSGHFEKRIREEEVRECKKEIFYKELYESVKIHSGIFKQHLWVMTKGKVTRLTLEEKERQASKQSPTTKPTSETEKETEAEKEKDKEIFEALGGDEEIEGDGEELDEDEEL